MKYAAQTSVSPERSRAEIESTLRRYGASKFMYAWTETESIIGFHAQGRNIRFSLPLPELVMRTPKGRKIHHPLNYREQATRQRWRALALAVKAKLETVESGIATFENEFMAYIVLPDGSTVKDHLTPMISEMYRTGLMPNAFLQLTSGKDFIDGEKLEEVRN